MAFHVACPITCRKICFCQLGFAGRLRTQEGRKEFLLDVARIEQFLNDPWLIKSTDDATVHVLVPKVAVSPATLAPSLIHTTLSKGFGNGGEGTAVKPAPLAPLKRVVLQKQAAVSIAGEDHVKKSETGDLVVSLRNADGGEQGQSNAKVMCQMCFTGENEGGDSSRKMLSCNTCGKKYHWSCLKRWSQNRDLFHWSSWACPSCRICEVCQKSEDPSKFMFCKRCDGAYHCYCQQPPHKNVGRGPFLCPKHTRCHSCSSNVPGNGLSVRWFLGYTCCDACGRLFVKGNFCPVCLKVYRDSESTPMVCCDVCQRWVHCPCDGISDAKYMEFQVDGHLQYVCPTCRGECPKIGTFEEAVQELWRRRDEAEKDLISSLKAAAGLPTQEENFDISPFSDDEETSPASKFEYGRSLKFSLKEFGVMSPKRSKESGKKSLNKMHPKESESSLMTGTNPAFGSDVGHQKSEFPGEDAGYLVDGTSAVNVAVANSASKSSRTIKIKSSKSTMDEVGANSGAPTTASGRKLVIHLGGRNRATSNSPKSEGVSTKKGPELTSSGTEDSSKLRHLEYIDRTGAASDKKVSKRVHDDQAKGSKARGKEGQVIKLKNVNPGPSKMRVNSAADLADGNAVSQKNVQGNKSSSKHAEDSSDINDSGAAASVSRASTKEGKPFLKFKIPKNSNDGNKTSRASSGTQDALPFQGKDELIYTRGQRSKRKRPALTEEDASRRGGENTMNDFADVNWVLIKLGKDAVGKRVEVHQPSTDSWRRGTVVEVLEEASTVSVALDDGKSRNYELGKQGIRFVSQKRKQ